MGTLTNSGKLIEKIESKQDELTAGEGIEIKNGDDYSAMQGPAPDGFHVPLNTEWQAVYDIRTALGGGSSDGTNFGATLKLPMGGYREYSGSFNSGSGRYRSSSAGKSPDANYISYSLNFSSSYLSYNYSYSYRVQGYSIRPFKNVPIMPTSNWAKLYGISIEAGGIFWDSTNGLISLSSDGSNWITIADKNLGATTVWNSGDELTDNNCGLVYQRGNNYGFPRTGSITSVSEKINASLYGPGNYYSSSTYRLDPQSGATYTWDSSYNRNLWGGETGVITYDNAIINTGVLSVNGQTGDVTISAGSEIVYCTQSEYDALPSSKLTDGKSYVIYE